MSSGHERIHPVVAGVADDKVAGRGKRLLDLARDRRVERGENDARTTTWNARLDLSSPAISSGMGAARRQGATAP